MIDERDISRRLVLKGIGAIAATIASPALAAESQPATTPAAAPASAVKFGVTCAQGAPFQQILSYWEGAEALGFDSAFVFDHFMAETPGKPEQERIQESWTLLSALAARTRRIRIGLLVNCCTYRHPAIVAKMASTVDQISNGRLILGLGAGWVEREHKAYGIPFHTKAGRARRLGEAVEVIRLLFSQERSTYSGKYFALKDAPLEPKPVQKPYPTILIGGSGRKLVQPIAAKYAQIWHFGLPSLNPEDFQKANAAFDETCRSVGRNPAEVVRATSCGLPTNDKMVSDLRAWLPRMIAAGMHYFILFPSPDNNLDPLKRFAQGVLPDFRR